MIGLPELIVGFAILAIILDQVRFDGLWHIRRNYRAIVKKALYILLGFVVTVVLLVVGALFWSQSILERHVQRKSIAIDHR